LILLKLIIFIFIAVPANRAEPSSELTLTGVLRASFHLADLPRLRVHAGVATVWTPDGRVVCFDLMDRAVLANLRTRS